MKINPNVGCVAGQDGHSYTFQMVYRPGSGHRGDSEIESILGMCSRCGDIYLQPVTRLERLAEDRDGREGAEVLQGSGLGTNSRLWSSGPFSGTGQPGSIIRVEGDEAMSTPASSTSRGSW